MRGIVLKFGAIIDLWPTLTEFALDVGEEREAVKGWHIRESIPGHAFKAVVAAAERRGYPGVTLQVLADAAAASKAARRAAKRGNDRSHLDRAA